MPPQPRAKVVQHQLRPVAAGTGVTLQEITAHKFISVCNHVPVKPSSFDVVTVCHYGLQILSSRLLAEEPCSVSPLSCPGSNRRTDIPQAKRLATTKCMSNTVKHK
jgi:hypothetical protein